MALGVGGGGGLPGRPSAGTWTWSPQIQTVQGAAGVALGDPSPALLSGRARSSRPQGLLTHGEVKTQRQVSKVSDQRVRVTSEVLASIKLIKMYTWEKPFAKIIKGAENRAFCSEPAGPTGVGVGWGAPSLLAPGDVLWVPRLCGRLPRSASLRPLPQASGGKRGRCWRRTGWPRA